MVRIILTTLFLAVVAAIGWSAYNVLPTIGVFGIPDPVLVDQCRRVDVAPGAEDVEIDEETGQVFISTHERRWWYVGSKDDDRAGGIYVLNLADPMLTPRLVSQSAPSDFGPHGISLWRGPDGERRLFVVNHGDDGREAIEMFDVAVSGDLTHTESVSFPEMYSPNDVAAVGARAFYATNDRRHDEGLMNALEIYGALPLTDVVYFDGKGGRIITDGLNLANGINVSADGSTIYVAEPLKRRISAYKRDIASGALALVKRWPVPTAPDNIDVAPDGALWLGGHPDLFAFLDHAEDADAIAPSQGVRLDPATGQSETRFMSVNGEINASSVAAASDDTLIIGAVFDGHVLVCPLD